MQISAIQNNYNTLNTKENTSIAFKSGKLSGMLAREIPPLCIKAYTVLPQVLEGKFAHAGLTWLICDAAEIAMKSFASKKTIGTLLDASKIKGDWEGLKKFSGIKMSDITNLLFDEQTMFKKLYSDLNVAVMFSKIKNCFKS